MPPNTSVIVSGTMAGRSVAPLRTVTTGGTRSPHVSAEPPVPTRCAGADCARAAAFRSCGEGRLIMLSYWAISSCAAWRRSFSSVLRWRSR